MGRVFLPWKLQPLQGDVSRSHRCSTGDESWLLSFALGKITVQSSPESFLGSMGTETDAAFLLSDLNHPQWVCPSAQRRALVVQPEE